MWTIFPLECCIRNTCNWHFGLCHHCLQLRIEARPCSKLQDSQWCGVGLHNNLFGIRPSPTEQGLCTLSPPPASTKTCNPIINWPLSSYTFITNMFCVIPTHRHVGDGYKQRLWQHANIPGHSVDAYPQFRTRICGRQAMYIQPRVSLADIKDCVTSPTNCSPAKKMCIY